MVFTEKELGWVFLLELLFTGEILEDVLQSEVTAEDTAQQLLKLTITGSEDNSGRRVPPSSNSC